MRKQTVILVVIFIVSQLLIGQISANQELFTQELFVSLAQNINDIPYIDTPDYTRIELENGLVVYLVQNEQLPIVQLQGYIKGGRSQETPDIGGISDLMVRLMNTGTQHFRETEFSRFKELHGIYLQLATRNDSFSFSGNSLSVDQAELIGLTADVLRNPKFDADYYERIIQEYYQLLLQAYYRDDLLLDMFFNTSLYGTHPYGHGNNIPMIMGTLQGMTPDALLNFYAQTIDPGNLVMTIVGDIRISEMEQAVQAHFGDWETQGIELKNPKISIDEANYNRIVLVHKEDATHARMKMGYNFYDWDFQDRVPFLMANRVFGSGNFSSRLMKTLRSELGYAYGIQSRTAYNQRGGLFFVSTDVDPAKTYDTREAIIEEVLAIQSGIHEITEEELFTNVNMYNALYPQSYRFPISVMGEVIHDIEFRGRDGSSINNFINEYNALTVFDVQQAFTNHAYPDKLLTVIVGRKDLILPGFVAAGIEIEVVDLF